MLVDLVKIQSNSVGTGAITLGDAVPGFRGREALTDGETYSYSVQQEGNWELGRGTLFNGMFVRSPLFSSDGGTAINLQPNASIAFVALAEDLKGSDTPAVPSPFITQPNFQSSGKLGVLNPIVFTKAIVTAADGYQGMFLRDANYAGGTAGNVNTAFTAYTIARAGTTAYEWAGLSVLDNYSDAGQNVGFFAQGNRRASGPTWGSVSEAIDWTGVPNPSTGLVGSEIDIRANGTDVVGNRVGADVVITRPITGSGFTGATMTAGYGVRVSSLDPNATVTRAFSVNMNSLVGYDTSLALVVSSAFRMAQGQSFAFTGDGSRQMSYDGSRIKFSFDSGVSPSFTIRDNGAIAVGTAGSIKLAPDQTIISQPLANSGDTQTSFWTNIVGNLNNATKREFSEVRSFYSSHGFGAGSTADKVTSYRAMWAAPGSSDAWTVNDLFHHETNDPINTHLYELDYDITTANKYGTTPGGAGLVGGTDFNGNPFSNVSAWGVFLTGISTNGGTLTGGYGVGSAGTNKHFQRGFVAAVGCIQSAFEDDSSAIYSYKDAGAHAIGVDTTSATYTSNWAFRMARGHRINSLNLTGTPSDLLYIDGSNNLRLADGAVSAVSVGAGMVPVVDNALQLGGGSFRWASVWAANGAIQTSDETLKTDIQTMTAPQTGAFLDALQPRLAKWSVGGRKAVMATEQQEVVTGYETLTDVELRPAKIADDGTVIRPAMVQDVRQPIIETKDVEVVTGYEDIPGKRTHGQILAQSVKTAYQAAGFQDFAGHVVDEEGVEHVRPDEILAVLIAEVQFLRGRVATLETKETTHG